MSQVEPQLSYPGGCSAFFTDLHRDFSRWLRLVALVPLVHASIKGIHYEELCSHLLNILPLSDPSNIFAVSVERIRSSVSEMLFEEPFFVCPYSDSNSISRWIYEPSLDSEPSRISFAFRILLCVNLYPNWSAYDLLSRVAGGTQPRTLSFAAPNILETYRQSGDDAVSGTPPTRSTSVPPVRVPISLLIEASVSPMKAGQDPSDQLEPSFSSGLEQTVNSGPFHLPRSLYLQPEVGLGAIGSKPLSFEFGTNQVSGHLSGPYKGTPYSFISPGLSIGPSYPGAADSAIPTQVTQQYMSTSDFPVLLGQLPNFSSPSCCDLSDRSHAKIPLFLPSQTPNRDLSTRDTLSSQASSLQKGQTSPLSVRPHRSRVASRNNYSHVGPLCASALQNVDATDLEEAISLHDGRSFHPTRFTTPKLAKSTWPIELASDDHSQTPAQLNLGSPRYQQQPGALGKRDRMGSGCATDKTTCSKDLHSRGDSGPRETPVLKRTKHATILAMAQDEPFRTPSADLTLIPSPLTPLDFGDHEGPSHLEKPHTRPSKASSTTKDDRLIPKQGCVLVTPSPRARHPDPGQNPPFSGACRPSVIVYKVARGPNLAESKDVVRISYGEGCQKRTRVKHSGRRSKRGAAMHLDLKSKADTLPSDKSHPAERIEGDMAWNFGVGSEMGERHANDRPQVRVGGLTSVRMIPRTTVDGEASTPSLLA